MTACLVTNTGITHLNINTSFVGASYLHLKFKSLIEQKEKIDAA